MQWERDWPQPSYRIGTKFGGPSGLNFCLWIELDWMTCPLPPSLSPWLCRKGPLGAVVRTRGCSVELLRSSPAQRFWLNWSGMRSRLWEFLDIPILQPRLKITAFMKYLTMLHTENRMINGISSILNFSPKEIKYSVGRDHSSVHWFCYYFLWMSVYFGT